MNYRDLFTKDGIPKNRCMEIETKEERIPKRTPGKVRDYPEWKNDPKPWANYPEKMQLYSPEAHWLYKAPERLGNGNYASLGVFRGGSCACLGYGLRDAGISGVVYGVDIFGKSFTYDNVSKTLKEENDIGEYIVLVKGFTFEVVENFQRDFRLIFIDADHHYESVKLDFELWSPLLADGGEIAFHDADMHTVDKFIQELDPEWKQTDEICRMKVFKR